MTTANATRPRPGCPACEGRGADVSAARFILVADDCENGPDHQPAKTLIYGYFRMPGHEHDDDAVLTADLTVPITSPIAQLAHQVTTSPTSVARTGDLLRDNVTRCPCTPATQCPALSEAQLIDALERATR